AVADVVVTTAVLGDVRPGAIGAAERLAVVGKGPWRTTCQVHGGRVALAASDPDGVEADALVGAPGDGVLTMFAADCALVGIVSPEGVTGVAHCGWRGLRLGVLEALAAEMRHRGATVLAAVRSPCIGPECYEVEESMLGELASSLGHDVSARTSAGRPALDLRAGVRRAARSAGIARLLEIDACTACDAGWFSHRARGDARRFCLGVGAGLA
ncbi:MAG: polyphenol oxidase family protein, partial [Acidimicrobiales bacterium]